MATKKKNWIQKANRQMKQNKTIGRFTEWCKRHGYSKVTKEAIAEAKRIAKKTGNTTLMKRAVFAENMLKINKKKKK